MMFRRLFYATFLALACIAYSLPLAAQERGVWCDALGKRLRSVNATVCRKLPFAVGQVRSVEGRPLMVRDVPPVIPATNTAPVKIKAGAAEPRAGRIFLIGGIHGDELTSVSIVFRWMEWLNENNARRYHWHIVPLANPDGLLAQPARRTNGHGVDLNRNFSTPDWSHDALAYWQKRTGKDPRRYPGKTASSEPETRWLEKEIENFKPDVIVSIHAPYGVLDYDGPLQKPRRFGRLNLNQLGVYPGSLGNFGGVYKNIPVITIELPHATAMPTPSEQRQIWDDMLAWIKKNIAP
jgi:hypothetical protein